MPTLLYIHGFLSSPQSAKAQITEKWLAKHRPEIHYSCPQLPPYPDESAFILEEIIESADDSVYLMGSSMGGFWATYFSERFDLKSLLINPAVNVMDLIPDFVNQTLTNYHHQTRYRLTENHVEELKKYTVAKPSCLSNYWLLVQTGDETLDYQLAVEKYQGSRQTVEEGGDHSFQGFERYLNDILQFFED
jgi:predicted esterase YcpF (UPF0227 family)